MSNVISVDFETFYSKRLKYTLKRQIAEQYCKHDLFDPYLISVSDGTQCWAGEPKDFNWQSLDGKIIVSHNAYFDNTVYDEMVVRGWAPKVNYVAWHCTANMTAYLCNRRALGQAVEHLYKIKLDKTARSDADNKHWTDFSASQKETMLQYARNDAFYCWKLWNDFSEKWPIKEQRLSKMTIDQGRWGVQIDVALLDSYIVASHEMKMNTQGLLPWLEDTWDDGTDDDETYNQKPTSTKCIAEQCRRVGIPSPPVKAHEGEEAYEEWETTYGKNHAWIAALSSWRSINKLYQTFTTVKERLRLDGTLPFALKYFGAHTGRWSGDARVNMQNMRKKPVFCNAGGLMITSEKESDAAIKFKNENGKWPETIKYALDFRNLFIPRPGKKMITSDLSQIEPRVLAWLAGDMATLDLIRGGMSIYEAHARVALGYTGDKLDKKSMLYAESKARVLALGYQAGWEKFIEMAADYTGMDLTEGDPEWIETPDGKRISGYGKRAKEIVAAYRAQNPKIKGTWEKLDELFKRSIGDAFVMNLPNGRKMTYEKVKCEARIEPDPETGKPRRKTVFTCDIGGRRVITYGGKLTENITQGMGRDVFAEHLLVLNDTPGIAVLFSSHDEAILEVDFQIKVCEVESIMSQCPEWCKGLPVSAEASEVERYQK